MRCVKFLAFPFSFSRRILAFVLKYCSKLVDHAICESNNCYDFSNNVFLHLKEILLYISILQEIYNIFPLSISSVII